MPQLLARAPQPPVVTSVTRMAPTRPVASPAVVDLARAHSTASAGPAGTTTSSRAKSFPALAMQPKPQKAPAPNNSRRPGKLPRFGLTTFLLQVLKNLNSTSYFFLDFCHSI